VRAPIGRSERGAAAIEAVLGLIVLAPLMSGLFVYGNYFWQAQRVDVYAPHLAQDSIVGRFTCAELIDRVTTTAEGLLTSTSGVVGADGSVVARVVEVVPTQGVTVNITVSLPVATPLAGILPHHGQLVSEVTQRLENVSLTTDSCL
jgi:Flp pilus assembly protein TadG